MVTMDLDREAEAAAFEEKQRPKISKSDLIWLAGFLDASGSLVTRGHPRLVVRHHDKEVALRVAYLTGGTVRGPKIDKFADRDKEGREYWLVTLYVYNKLKPLYELLVPHLSAERAEEVTKALASNNPPNARVYAFSQENCGYYDQVAPSMSGAKKHVRAGERPCRMCMESQRLYARRKDQGLL